MILILLGVLAVGIFVGVAIYATISGNREADAAGLNPEQEKAKEDNLARVLDYARTKSEIGNDDIEHLLGVSNATAERYLNELESRGHLVQIGTTGRGVRYKVK